MKKKTNETPDSSKPQRLPAQRSAAAAFEEAVGGREQLVEVLSSQVRGTKQDILLRLLSDPGRAGDSLVRDCQDAGMSTTEVLGMFRDAAVARSMVQAQNTLADKLDGVVRDVAEKASNHVEECQCQILSAVGEPDPTCPECGGRGLLFFRGNLKHAEMVFKAPGLTKEGGGVNVNVKQQVGLAMGGGFLDKFVQATDEAAFDVVDADPIDVEETDPEAD